MKKHSTPFALATIFAVLLLSPIFVIAEDAALVQEGEDSGLNNVVLNALLEMKLDSDPADAASRVKANESLLADEGDFGILSVNSRSSWGDTCNLSLCCGDEHCQVGHVEEGCEGTCDPATFLCVPNN